MQINHFEFNMIVSALLALTLLSILMVCSMRRPKHFPPGPVWLPFLGNSVQIKDVSNKLGGLHVALQELSKQWKTNVLGLKLGREFYVVVSHYPTVKKVLSSEDFDSRPANFFMRLRCLGKIKGITCENGENWQIQRTFLVKTLRHLGFGRHATQLRIQQEAGEIIHEIHQDGAVKVGKVVAPAVISVLWSLITGTHLSRHNHRLVRLLDLFQARARLFDMSGGILAQYPWLRFVAPEKTGYNLIKTINEELKGLFMGAIREHHDNWTPDSDQDFMYAFISEMKKDGAHYTFTDDQLLMVCLDLFIAGAQTTSSTLDFAFLEMLRHPEIQSKVQRQLDDLAVKGEPINYYERHKFAYIEAVLLEAARYHTIAPIIGPRRVTKDVHLEGYIIPKGTTVLVNTYSVHTDPSRWDDPHLFKPERFLTPEGALLPSDELLQFGLGRRRCPGESLARTCTFVFFAEIIRNFTIVEGLSKRGEIFGGLTLSAEYSAEFVTRTTE